MRRRRDDDQEDDVDGIQMDALQASSKEKDSAKRSTTLILVKNLPYDTTLDELSKMFLVFAGDANILLPPSRTIALVDFKNPSNAYRFLVFANGSSHVWCFR